MRKTGPGAEDWGPEAGGRGPGNSFEELAALLEYPSAVATGVWPVASVEELQELYISTFDLNPACTLEVGWHLYGENYERGEFLVRMRGEIRRYGLPEDRELPDHLSHALRVLGRMEPDRGEEFASTALLPALAKMRAALDGKENPYGRVLAGIEEAIRGQFPAASAGACRPVFPIFQEAAHEF